MYIVLEKHLTHAQPTAAKQQLAGQEFSALLEVGNAYDLTVGDVRDAATEEHDAVVQTWARRTYQAWKDLRVDVEGVVEGF